MSIKKTYIPAKPRNKKLIGTGGSGGISSSMSGAVANSHTHANKAVLDLFKQDSDGNVYLEQSFYSMGGISALGLGEGGGGGGGSSVQMEDYGATSISLTVDGLQRYIARSNHNHNIFALEGINPSIGFTEGYVLTWNATTLKLELRAPTGGGGTSASWGVTNNNQSPLTVDGVSKIVSLSGHTHAISNITNLQSTLNNKVDKVTGKSLILDTEITRLANVDNQTLTSLGAEPAFSKNTAFNKNFGTVVGTVAQGNHLHTGVYEPSFTKNTAFNKNFGTVEGTVAEGNDSRIDNGQTAYDWGNHASAGYALSSALSGYVPTTRTITAGNGLTGGGTLSANRTLTLGTPSTLTNATTNEVTATSHTHAITTTTVGASNTIVATDASGGVRGNIIRIGANWTLELSGTELVFKYNGVIKQRMLSDGTILGTGGITALSTD